MEEQICVENEDFFRITICGNSALSQMGIRMKSAPGAKGNTTSLSAIKAAWKDWSQRLKPETRRCYENDLRVFAGLSKSRDRFTALVNLCEAGKGGAENLILKWRGAGIHKRTTVNRRLSMLRSFFGYLHDAGLIAWDLEVPNLPVRSKQQPKSPAIEDLGLMIRKLGGPRTPRDFRDLAILRLLIETGIKRGELCRLNVSDFQPLNNRIRVFGPGRRTLKWHSISNDTTDVLSCWIMLKPGRPAAPLFVNMLRGRTGRLTGSAIGQIVANAAKKVRGRASPEAIRRAHLRALDEAEKVHPAIGIPGN